MSDGILKTKDKKLEHRKFSTDAVEQIIGYQLRKAQLEVFQQFHKRFAAFDVRPAEFSVLALIAENPGCKQIEIARALGIKRANLVALLNRLETKGWIVRQLARGDRRSHALFLTSEGQPVMDALNSEQNAFEAEFVALLGGEAERDRLMTLLKKISQCR